MDDEGTITGFPVEDAAEEPAEDASRPGSSRTRALARAGITVTILFLVSRILGYLRYVVIAAAVPNVRQLDSFFAAFRIPDFLFQLVAAGALSSALIPIIAGLFATDQEARAWRVVSTVATLMLSALLLLAALVLLVAPQLVAFITPGFDPDKLALTTDLTRIMVVAPCLLAMGAVASSALNARGRFGAAAVAPIVYNFAIIVGAIVLVPAFGIAGLAMSVVAGSLGHVLVQLPVLARVGARIRPGIDLRDSEARKALLLMAPRAVGLGFTQIVFLVMTGLASGLADGSIAVFTFAFAILQIPIGVIGVPLGVVLLPSLSREAALGARDAFSRLLIRGLSMLAFVMIGLTGLGIVLSADITRLLFGHGGVSEEALKATSVALAVFLVGLTAHSLIAVLARAFYAMQDTRTPVGAAIFAVAINIGAANLLVGPYGIAGLAGAIALGAWIELIVLTALLRRRLPGLGLGSVVVVMAKATVVSIAGAGVAWLVAGALVGAWGEAPGFLPLLLRICVVTAAGGIVILAGSVALRIEQLRTIVDIVVDLLRRKGRA